MVKYPIFNHSTDEIIRVFIVENDRLGFSMHYLRSWIPKNVPITSRVFCNVSLLLTCYGIFFEDKGKELLLFHRDDGPAYIEETCSSYFWMGKQCNFEEWLSRLPDDCSRMEMKLRYA